MFKELLAEELDRFRKAYDAYRNALENETADVIGDRATELRNVVSRMIEGILFDIVEHYADDPKKGEKIKKLDRQIDDLYDSMLVANIVKLSKPTEEAGKIVRDFTKKFITLIWQIVDLLDS